MDIVFVVLGIVLVALFLVWILLVRPGTGRRWMTLVLDAALIAVSVAVFTTGFMIRSEYIAEAAAETEGEGMPNSLENLQEMEDSGGTEESPGGTEGDQKFPTEEGESTMETKDSQGQPTDRDTGAEDNKPQGDGEGQTPKTSTGPGENGGTQTPETSAGPGEDSGAQTPETSAGPGEDNGTQTPETSAGPGTDGEAQTPETSAGPGEDSGTQTPTSAGSGTDGEAQTPEASIDSRGGGQPESEPGAGPGEDGEPQDTAEDPVHQGEIRTEEESSGGYIQ